MNQVTHRGIKHLFLKVENFKVRERKILSSIDTVEHGHDRSLFSKVALNKKSTSQDELNHLFKTLKSEDMPK